MMVFSWSHFIRYIRSLIPIFPDNRLPICHYDSHLVNKIGTYIAILLKIDYIVVLFNPKLLVNFSTVYNSSERINLNIIIF